MTELLWKAVSWATDTRCAQGSRSGAELSYDPCSRRCPRVGVMGTGSPKRWPVRRRTNISQGNVNFALAGMLLLGSIPGVLIGSRTAPWLPGTPLKVVLSLMLVFVGSQLLLR